ncbi:hypothetical protein ACFGZ1_11200 [Pasteurella multocida]
MSISNEKWQEITIKLGMLTSVAFMYGSHLIEVKPKIYKGKIIWVVYIDACIKGEWVNKENQMFNVVAKVWFKKSRHVFTAKEKRNYKGVIDKKMLNQKLYSLIPWFSSCSTLIRQFKKLDGLTLKED